MDNKFYTVEMKMKSVSQEEFRKFLENYPRSLEADVCGWAEPITVTYNDFELANRWPYSIVATSCRETATYKIAENIDEVFKSKTGYRAGAGE